MILPRALGLLLALVLAAPAAAQPGTTLHLRMQAVMDPHGFAQPVAAKALLVPVGWGTTGGVRWKVGADFTGAVGVYQQRWFLAGEFGYDEAIITYLTHSDWYREHYYPEAKDGWYLNTDGTFHYGLTTGVSIGQTEIAVRAGQRRTEDFQELSQPFYLSMGVGVRF